MIKAWIQYGSMFAVFFVGAVLQGSIVPYISIAGALPNLLLVAFFIILLIKNQSHWVPTIFCCMVAGALLDILEAWPFGVGIISLVAAYSVYWAMQRIITKKQGSFDLLYDTLVFIGGSAAFYLVEFFLAVVLKLPQLPFQLIIKNTFYGLMVFHALFWIWHRMFGSDQETNQLKLF